jgi:hypothetical protein
MFNTEALRRFGDGKAGDVSGACRWAADEIERLCADVARLEATLLWLGDHEPQLVDAALNIHKGGAALSTSQRGDE